MSASTNETIATPHTPPHAGYDPLEEKPSFQTLSPEIRCMIYSYIVKGTGKISVFSQHNISKEVDATTVHLLHVNRLIRCEVQEFFYKSQTFEFRSASAVNKFLETIGPWHASLIRNVQLGPWLCARKIKNFVGDITPAFQNGLTGVERLSIPYPLDPHISFRVVGRMRARSSEVPNAFLRQKLDAAHGSFTSRLQPGLKTYAILCASQQLASGKIYLKLQSIKPTEELLFVPSSVEYPAEVTEDNPQWAKYEEIKKNIPDWSATQLGLQNYNPHAKTQTVYFKNVVVPDMSVMRAALASALTPLDEDTRSSEKSEIGIDASSADNVRGREDRGLRKRGRS